MSNSETKQLFGRHSRTQEIIEIRYGQTIESVDDVVEPLEKPSYIAPGFVDLQVNGFAGVDYNDPASTTEAIASSLSTMFSTGVTRCFPTVITGSPERMAGAIHNLAQSKEELERSNSPQSHAIAGLHIEGPHLSPEEGPRGAHPIGEIRPPDIEEFKGWQGVANGLIKLITISPEWDEAPRYIKAIVREGVVASIGHTKATAEQIKRAVDSGATVSTHLGNATHAVLPKTNNYLWDQLADERLAACFIIDGIHIPQSFFRVGINAKGLERCVLVTDAVMPAMCAPGLYRLGEVSVELRFDGSVVKPESGRLAGSALRMDHAVAKAVPFGNIPLHSALVMASTNAARVGRVAGRQRYLSPGDHADFVRFDWDAATQKLTVLETIVAGTTVYRV